MVIKEWCVLGEETLGCHQLIRYAAVSKGGRGRAAKADDKQTSRGWQLDEDTLGSFKESFKRRPEKAKADGKADVEGRIKCVVKVSNKTLRQIKANRHGEIKK